MTRLRRWVECEIRPSAEELAEVFWSMDAEEQSDFFNKLGEKEMLVSQLQAITDNPQLSSTGRGAMRRIGEYSEKIGELNEGD